MNRSIEGPAPEVFNYEAKACPLGTLYKAGYIRRLDGLCGRKKPGLITKSEKST